MAPLLSMNRACWLGALTSGIMPFLLNHICASLACARPVSPSITSVLGGPWRHTQVVSIASNNVFVNLFST